MSSLEELTVGLEAFVATLDVSLYHGDDAVALVRLFDRCVRAGCYGRGQAARRVEDTDAWTRHGRGERSAAEWLSHQTGTTTADAGTELATAHRLELLPETDQQARAGTLSPDQTAEIADAATTDPAAEQKLLRQAETAGMAALRRAAQAAKTAARARSDQADARQRIHQSRYCRTWTGPDGAFEGRFRLTPDAGAVVAAALDAHHNAIFSDLRGTADRHDSAQAIHADALVAMAEASVSREAPGNSDADRGPTAVIHVRVDHAAFTRGWTHPGETCEADGVGPITVGAARCFACDSVIRALLTDGDTVIDARHVGRTIPARLRTALHQRDRTCVVPGCDARRHLEIHHLDPIANHGPTSLANTCRICPHHHDQITHRGAVLAGPGPHWTWYPPGTTPPAATADADPPP